ncbi:hypothetical protein BCR44DRAFT_47375 [Catenaria anguillulae PL171]|uniref:Uncharacterized protein n=1 Tax=Catenaria anguillulae PL171 TaxID=765915 RepID=A0A1Y2HWU1_9FUNG|nr:hypothetical protein BCR44DRAFT_47375 [Catenaria anguillulae PL171]
MMHASHIHVRTPTNPSQPVQVDPCTSDSEASTTDYHSFASSRSSSSSSSSASASTTILPSQSTLEPPVPPKHSPLSDRDLDRDFNDLGFGTPIASPGSPHAQQPRHLSVTPTQSDSSSGPASSPSGDNQSQPLDLALRTQEPASSLTAAAEHGDTIIMSSTRPTISDTEIAAPNSPPIKTTTNTLPHFPADAAPATFQVPSPPTPSMPTYTMPAGPATGVPPASSMPGISSLFPSALGLMTGTTPDWSAQQQPVSSSYYFTSQPQMMPMRPPKVYGPLGTYEQLLDNVISAAWSVAGSVWAMAKTAASWIVAPVKNVGWYYLGMAADTLALYWRASPHLRVFVYAFGLITAIPLAIFAGYAAVTLGITLAIASGGTLLASGAALGGGMLVLGPILLFSLIGAGLLTLAVSVLSGGWHVLFGGGEQAMQQQQSQMMMAGGGYVPQQPQPQQSQGLIGSVLSWLAPTTAPTVPTSGTGYYDAGMLKQPPGTYAGAAGMQMQQQQPDVLAR